MITRENLQDLLSFEENLESVEIINQVDAEPEMTFVMANLTFTNNVEMEVAFVYPNNEDWIFTPADWQGVMPQNTSEVADIEWRVDDSEIPGYIVNGLPRAFLAEPSEIKKEMRSEMASAIRAARKEKGWSLRELSAKTGIAYPNLSRFENGRGNINLDSLSIILSVLGLRIKVTEAE